MPCNLFPEGSGGRGHYNSDIWYGDRKYQREKEKQHNAIPIPSSQISFAPIGEVGNVLSYTV